MADAFLDMGVRVSDLICYPGARPFAAAPGLGPA